MIDPKFEKSLLAAIDGSYEGMAHADLVLTCNMLVRGRAIWQQECETERAKAKELWQVLVMLKREFDSHETQPDKLEIPKWVWAEAIRRAKVVWGDEEKKGRVGNHTQHGPRHPNR